METHTVYSPPVSDYALESDTPSLPPGKEYILKMVNMNGIDIAAFNVDGEDLLCFPQVYEYFLKELVSGMHTVYTKLKRMNIQGRNCNVEQVRMMRSVGAIGQVVNRCKLISKEDFTKIYEDCILYRGPGRRKKNPEIPPELLNSPFKHFKVDHSNDHHDPDHVSMDTSDSKPMLPCNHVTMATKEEIRDGNNNHPDGETAFKVPMTQHVTSPRYANQHVIHSRTSTSPIIINGSTGNGSQPTGSHSSPTAHPMAFSFNSRTAASLSNLPTMVNMRSHMPHSSPSLVLSLPTQASQSPTVRTSVGEVVIVEPSVPHVSSTGTSEHAEHRGNVTSDAGSSESSPRVTSREMEFRDTGSIETLLLNIQGLLNVAAENARQQQRQAYMEKEELRRQLQRDRDALQKSERLCASLQRGKAFLQKKLKREKKAKRKLSEKVLEEQQRYLLLEQELRGTSQEAMKQMNESLIQELDRERSAKGEAERKLQEARGEIQNFMQNFLENPSTVRSQQKQHEIVSSDQEHSVKEEDIHLP